jgi:uncharacterized C2H2 Zn-finger protein
LLDVSHEQKRISSTSHVGNANISRDTNSGVKPNQIPCPDCGKPFKTKSEMERHRDTTHHVTKGRVINNRLKMNKSALSNI